MLVPDIGGAEKVDVIEVHIKPGDKVEVESPLVTLEGDKASMEVPSECAGTVVAVQLTVGDTGSAGDQIGLITVEGSEVASESLASANRIKLRCHNRIKRSQRVILLANSHAVSMLVQL